MGGERDPEQTIRKVIADLASAWNRHDMKVYTALFSEDADYVSGAGSWWRGRREIEKEHAERHAAVFKESRVTITGTSIRLLQPEIAIVHSTWELEGLKDPDGRDLPGRKGILTQVVAREQDGRWRIVASQNTDIPPPEDEPDPAEAARGG